MGLFKKIHKKMTDAFSFEDEMDGAQQKERPSEDAKSGATESSARAEQLTDKQIVADLRDFLDREGSVITVGDTKLVPHYFTIYLSREDYRRWMSVEVVRDTLVAFVVKQLTGILSEIQGEQGLVKARDIHVSIKADEKLSAGTTEVRATIDKEAGFSEIVAKVSETEDARRQTAREAAPTPKAEPEEEDAQQQPAQRAPKPPPKPRPRPTPPPQPAMETRVVEPTEPEHAKLSLEVELLVEDADSRDRYTLPTLPVTIGRYTEGGVDIADESQHLSRRHLEFSQNDEGGLQVKVHERARNATSVDGIPVAPGETISLTDRSEIVVADLRITVHVTGL